MANLLATLDVGPAIEGMAGRRLRTQMFDHRDGVATDYGQGAGWPENRYTIHWLENRETVPTLGTSVDIIPVDE